MARTLDDYLKQYYRRKLKLEKEDVPDFYIEEYKNDMGNQMAKWGLGNDFSASLCSSLAEDEEILFLGFGFSFYENSGCLLLSSSYTLKNLIEWVVCMTNHKIIVYSQGILGSGIANTTIKSIPLKSIHSSQKSGDIVKIQTGTIKYYFDQPGYASEFFEKLNEILDSQTNSKTNVPSQSEQQPIPANTLEQLERLSQLYQQGLLTEQEFQIQKEKILENR
ncbi:MAG: SHOCT domain-containing protein [Thermoguttaceae bacterium]|nr:SHOCT domain-containing protein [Thermoguttaceae bacterium]